MTAAAGPLPIDSAKGLTIGLTGGIGSGKSTVAQMLVGCGAHLVDTDAISRGLTLPGGAAVPAIAAAFGSAALTTAGALDRDYMRGLVFADATAKARLEAILHPLIGQQALQQAQIGIDAGKAVVFDIPLLAESVARGAGQSWRDRVRRVLVIDCSESTQIARVAQRPGWSTAAAASVVAQQATRAARRAIADAVIHNDGISLVELQAEVSRLWELWTRKAVRAEGGAG